MNGKRYLLVVTVLVALFAISTQVSADESNQTSRSIFSIAQSPMPIRFWQGEVQIVMIDLIVSSTHGYYVRSMDGAWAGSCFNLYCPALGERPRQIGDVLQVEGWLADRAGNEGQTICFSSCDPSDPYFPGQPVNFPVIRNEMPKSLYMSNRTIYESTYNRKGPSVGFRHVVTTGVVHHFLDGSGGVITVIDDGSHVPSWHVPDQGIELLDDITLSYSGRDLNLISHVQWSENLPEGALVKITGCVDGMSSYSSIYVHRVDILRNP